jgi:hypothetical protein
MRILGVVLLVCCLACAHRLQPAKDPPEAWFHHIRAVGRDEEARCRAITSVETQIEAAALTPPIPREDYRSTRRIAFQDFEAKVMAAGGNAVRITRFSESGSRGSSQFALDGVHLVGNALACP